MIGIDPGPFTLRNLVLMAEGRATATWNQTASIIAMIAEVNRNPKARSKPYSPDDFNPMAEPKRKQVIDVSKEEGFALLKKAFIRS